MSLRTDDHRVMASTAPRGSRDPGSPDWCYQTMNLMKRSYDSIQTDHKRFESYLSELREHKAWEKVPVERPYGSEERMLEVEIGKRTDQIEGELAKIRQMKAALVAERIDEKDRENQRPQGRPKNIDTNKNGVNVFADGTAVPDGNSSAAALRRLRKDRPDIHARILAGELTPHAGMIEAGFREKAPSRKLTPFDRLRYAIERLSNQLTPAERLQLKDLLND